MSTWASKEVALLRNCSRLASSAPFPEPFSRPPDCDVLDVLRPEHLAQCQVAQLQSSAEGEHEFTFKDFGSVCRHLPVARPLKPARAAFVRLHDCRRFSILFQERCHEDVLIQGQRPIAWVLGGQCKVRELHLRPRYSVLVSHFSGVRAQMVLVGKKCTVENGVKCGEGLATFEFQRILLDFVTFHGILELKHKGNTLSSILAGQQLRATRRCRMPRSQLSCA